MKYIILGIISLNLLFANVDKNLSEIEEHDSATCYIEYEKCISKCKNKICHIQCDENYTKCMGLDDNMSMPPLDGDSEF